MLADISFVGCRINCYIFGIPKFGFSIPVRGWTHPNIQNSKLWHFPIPVKIVETKYHFKMNDDKLLSFSVQPNSSNSEDVYRWLKTLDQTAVEILEPYTETSFIIPESYFGEEYSGEIYPEHPALPPPLSDYRDRVYIIRKKHRKKVLR